MRLLDISGADLDGHDGAVGRCGSARLAASATITDSHTYLSTAKALERDGYTIGPDLRIVRHQATCAKLLDASSRGIYARLTEAALVVAAEHDRIPADRRTVPVSDHVSTKSPLGAALARLAAAARSRASLMLLAEIQSRTAARSSDTGTDDTATPDT